MLFRSATGKGFVKAEDARMQIKGDPDAIREAQQEDANSKLGTIADYMGQLVATGVISAEKMAEMVETSFKNKEATI